MIKKIYIGLLILLVAFNPIVPALVIAQELQTGSGSAMSESVSEVNTTSIDSEITTTLTTIASDEEASAPFDLPPSGSATEASETVVNSPPQEIVIDNQATNETVASTTVETGGNTQLASGSASMSTGDSVALSSAISLTNTTLIDSTLQVGVVAITKSWSGDIVLDPVTGESIDSSFVVNELQVVNEEAEVTTNALAVAQTGNNSQTASGSATMSTGDAMAIAQSNVVVNTTLIDSDVFVFNPTNLWLWSGKILNWEGAGSINGPSALSNISSQNGVGCSGSCSTNISIRNEAEVETSAVATASTGGNTQIASGDALMSTGDAYAGAVSTSIVNTTLINSRYRLLSLLLFSPWSGNLVFAYPDLAVEVRAPNQVYEGEPIPYTAVVKNIDYGKAKNPTLFNQVTQSETLIYENQENWNELAGGQAMETSFSIATDGRAGQTIQLNSQVSNESAEVSQTNNGASATTLVLARPISQQTSNNQTSTEVPTLRLSSQNNVNNFVYGGDSVTYDVRLTNEGPISAKNLVLYQIFYSPEGEKIGGFQGKLGSLAISRYKDIRFVITSAEELPEGNYYTVTWAEGESDQGAGAKSNEVDNDIRIKLKELATNATELVAPPVLAQNNEGETVLGATNTSTGCGECVSFPWYIAISIGSLVYYLMIRRHQDYARSVRLGLTLPLTAYVGLLLSNPSCTQGIMMSAHAGPACQWFLPLAYLIYSGVLRIAVMTSRLESRKPAQV